MKTKFDGHTKGPWDVQIECWNDEYEWKKGFKIKWFMRVYTNEPHPVTPEERVANPELIKAAPDMLEELIKCRELIKGQCEWIVRTRVDDLIKARAIQNVGDRLAAIDKLIGVE